MSSRKEYELIMAIKAELGSNFRSSFNTASESVRGLQTRVSELNKVQGDVSAYRNTEKAIADLKAKKEELINTEGVKASEINKVNKQIEKQEEKLAGLNDKLKESGVDTRNLSSESEKLGEEYRKLKAEQEKLANLDKWEKENAAALSRARADFLATTAVVTAAGAAFYRAFITPAANFEAEMSNIAALTGYNAEQMKRLGDEVRSVSQATGTPIQELASKANMLVEAGGDLDLVIEQMRYGTNLAKGTGTEIGLVFDFTSAAMKTFHMEAEESRAVMDSMAYTTSLTNLNLSQIAESYVNVGGSAKNAGFGINDVNAQLIVMSEAGLKGGAAGTSLNAILRNLSTPTDKAAGALEELGVRLYDAEGASRDMFDIMGDLQNSLSDLTDEQKNNYQQTIFDTVAQKGWNMLADEGIDSIRELSDNIAGASEKYDGLGQSAGMAGVQLDNLKGDLALNKVAISELGMSVGEIFLPKIREAAQGMTGMINSASGWVKENPETVRQVVELGGKIAVLTVGVKGFILAKAAATKQIIGFKMMANGAAAGAGTLARALQTANPVVAGVGLTLAGLATAVELNKAKMRELSELYADPLLFDNGGRKLSEITDEFIKNTRYAYENAQATIATRESVDNLRYDIQGASRDIDIYGNNLRQHGTLSPKEAEALREPIADLARLLNEITDIRFEGMIDGFKNAAGIASELGVDVAKVVGGLEGLNRGHNDNVTNAQLTIDDYLNAIYRGKGEGVTQEEHEEFQRAMDYLRSLETLEERRTLEKEISNFSQIDFGSDYKAAQAEAERLIQYKDELISAIHEAQKAQDELYESGMWRVEHDYEHGQISRYEFEQAIKLLELSRSSSQESAHEYIEAINAEIRNVFEKALGQVQSAERNLFNNMSTAQMLLSGFVGKWHTSGDYDSIIAGSNKSLFDTRNLLEDSIGNTYRNPVFVDGALNQRVKDNISGFLTLEAAADYYTQKGDTFAAIMREYYEDDAVMRAHFEERISNSEKYRRLQEPAYMSNSSAKTRGTSVEPINVTIADSSGKEIKVEVNYAPVITIEGNASDDLEGILQREREGLKREFADMIRESEVFEKRTRYK
ncbi:MAG: phage tail tape measure protein [Oscillospiraceae bacterium]|jgi:TP901 family phage tail tape measure protein|nr:phage tail tape measure protein [Oscillospiraceae bacterium]